jgi:tetratricopeptide (TPR) repeat protein
MLTERDRAVGHRLAGEWLEQYGESDPIVLARHFELGQEAARAGVFYLRAAEQALQGMDLDAALEHAERALASGLAHASQVLCLGVLSEVHSWRSEWERSAAYSAQVMRLAEQGSDPWIKGATARHTAAFRLGRQKDFMDTIAALMSVDPAPEVTSALVDSLYIAFLVTCLLGNFNAAERVLARVSSLVVRIGDRDPIARGWMLAGHAYWEAWVTGELCAALRHMEAACADFELAGDTRHAQYSQTSVGMIQWNLGRLAEAERVLRDPIGEADDHLVALTRSLYRTLVLIDRGDLDEARELAERRIEIARRKPQGPEVIREVEGRWLLGEIAYRTGDLDTADREITAAVAALPALTRKLATATLAAVRLERGRVDEAVALGRELLESVAAHGGAGHRAGRIRLVYAEALRASGDRAAANAMLGAARSELLAKAARITDAEVRQRFLDDLPEHRRTLALAAEWGV